MPTLVSNGVEATSDSQKANVLNTFFSTCWNRLAPPLSPVARTHVNNDDMTSSCFQFLCVEEDIYPLLCQLDTSKATGPDGISARMLKETAATITYPLTLIFNLSLQQRCFPSSWKYAKVVPIPKDSASKSSPNNYRPISLL